MRFKCNFKDNEDEIKSGLLVGVTTYNYEYIRNMLPNGVNDSVQKVEGMGIVIHDRNVVLIPIGKIRITDESIYEYKACEKMSHNFTNEEIDKLAEAIKNA